MFGFNAAKSLLAKFVLLLAVALATNFAFTPSANADPYVTYNISNLYFFNGNQIKVEGTLSNTGDTDATVTEIYISSIQVWDGNDNVLFNGWLRMSNMSVYLSAGGSTYYEFYVNGLELPYYEGYMRWRYDSTISWQRH